MEGISHEFASLAGHLGLSHLIVLYDDNKISIDGATSITMSDNSLERFQSVGWHTIKIDGYDLQQIDSALVKAKETSKPTLIACQTLIGYGAPNKQGTAGSHGAPLGEEEIKRAKLKMMWNYDKFEIPSKVLEHWREIGIKNKRESEEWRKKHLKTLRYIKSKKDDLSNKLAEVREKCVELFLSQNNQIATRKSSEMVLSELDKKNLNLLGGSADLTGSNNTFVASMTRIKPKNFEGNYIHWGVREHCMAAAMNGIALHGYFIPYGGTFLVFSDYCRPSIRLSALMKLRVIYVFTHDSIGLGEDGPTHQPVEHLSSLRLIPNTRVFRPCDSIETAECWELALLNDNGPSILALTRQSLKQIRDKSFDIKENFSNKGAYIVKNFKYPDLSIVATGSEVELAIETSEKLAQKDIKARVISMPCMEIFQLQEKDYIEYLMKSTKNIFIEAGSRQSWDKWIKEGDIFIGLNNFGASGPGKDVFDFFQINLSKVLKEAEKMLK